MKEKFENYILQNQLFTKKDKLLVAVSGGVDSMLLVYLLQQCGYSFSIAHCNYNLRADESDGDEYFVRKKAADLNVHYHVKRFDTERYAQKEKKSIQEAARDLRYEWFEHLRQKFDYQWIITAHHASDSVETMLFNFARGSGLRGLKGIQPKNRYVVRPLLFATKSEILELSKKIGIIHREDSSNQSYKYTRNFIRHQIIPAFQHINPEFEKTAIENITHLGEANILLNFFIEKIKKEVVETVDNQCFIDKKKLQTYPSVSTILLEILSNYNFNKSHVEQILCDNSYATKVGTKFYSPSHVLLIDRDFYVIQPIVKATKSKSKTLLRTDHKQEYLEGAVILGIEADMKEILFNGSKMVLHQFMADSTHLSKDKNLAQLDIDQLTFPLKLRHWKHGDTFKPIGMRGKNQKLSDFFNQNKISSFDKGKIWILETAKNEICWIVGYRIDDRFKMTETTVKCFKIELKSLS